MLRGLMFRTSILETIWITGGSSGIGFATAKKFLKNKWRVIISSSNLEKLKRAKIKLLKETTRGKLHYIKCNISLKDEVNKTIDLEHLNNKSF